MNKQPPVTYIVTGGIYYMGKYPIYYCDQIIGNAELEKQGLFYMIRCQCDLPQDQLFKVLVMSKENTFDLGICTKSDKGMGLVTRIGVNILKNMELRFIAEPEQYANGKMYAISDNSEFPELMILANAKFIRRNGKAFICTD